MNNSLQDGVNQLLPLVGEARRIAILVGEPSFDQLAAGLSLYLSLADAQKETEIFTANLPAEGLNNLAGKEALKTDFGADYLSIVFNYPLEKIDRVSSDDSEGKLKLIVRVKPEAEEIRPEQIVINPQQNRPDLGFVFGDERLFNLPQDWFDKSGNWVWFSHFPGQKNWAKISIIEPELSYSEVVARIVQSMGLPMNVLMGKNLFLGIKQATDSFEKIFDYHTLETAALCFKVFQTGEGKNINETVGRSSLGNVPIESVENKEPTGIFGSFPAPKIFKGSTTPKN